GAQARAQPAPALVMRERRVDDAYCALGRIGRRADLALDARPLGRDPALVGGEEDRSLVGEMLVEGRRRIARSARPAGRAGAVVAVAIEHLGGRGDQTLACLFRPSAARSGPRAVGSRLAPDRPTRRFAGDLVLHAALLVAHRRRTITLAAVRQ